MYFDDFEDNQSVSYSLLKNSLLKEKLSHAYLIDANYNENAYDFIIAFIKMILCDHHYSNYFYSKCKDCNQCARIDNGNYPEIRIIEPEHLVIKKEQLLELQNDFSQTSIEGKYLIYIIKDCDKMNKQASNSLLKFLEEPVDGIIAILCTNHFSKLLSTIVSRCQIIHLNHSIKLTDYDSFLNCARLCCDSEQELQEFMNDESKKVLIKSVFDFILYFEENGLDILLFMKKMWYNNVQTREDNLLSFQIMIYFYYDVLKYKVNDRNFIFCNDLEFIEKVANFNSLDAIIKKIDVIQYGYDMVFSNLNVNLLLDDIIIRLGEVT